MRPERTPYTPSTSSAESDRPRCWAGIARVVSSANRTFAARPPLREFHASVDVTIAPGFPPTETRAISLRGEEPALARMVEHARAASPDH